MSVNADIMHDIKGKVCLLMLTGCMLSEAKYANVDIMHAIKGKVFLLMLTSCMLSKAKCVC